MSTNPLSNFILAPASQLLIYKTRCCLQLKMKYLSLLVPLFLAWVVCVNAEQPPEDCTPVNGEKWCMNGGRCEVEQVRATCHCAKDFKGQRCQIDSSKDKPLDKIPPNYEEVEPEARALVYQIKCTALTTPGRTPAGCGFGYALQHFRVTGPFWWVYIWVRVKCCCWPCRGPPPTIPGQGPNCREVFPALGRPAATYNTWDNWMCFPPPAHP